MAYIDYIPVPEWDLDPDNIIRIHGVNSAVLRAHFDLYKVTMFGKSPLSRTQREMVAVVVSAVNNCHY
jgi:hypothetical protein